MIRRDYTLTAIPRATSKVGNAGNDIGLLKLRQERNIYRTGCRVIDPSSFRSDIESGLTFRS